MKVELSIDIDSKTAGCIAMPEFTQDWIYKDEKSAYAHEIIAGIQVHIWMRTYKEKGEEVAGTTIDEDVIQDKLIEEGWTPPAKKGKRGE